MLSSVTEDKVIVLSQQDLNPILAAHERFVAYQGGQRAQLPQRGLDGLNFANRNLSEADLAGATLVGATLYGSNLQRVSLYCADLRGCNLQRANLTRADLRGASFKGANLCHAILDGADMRAARMMIVDAKGSRMLDRNADSGPAGAVSVPNGVDFSNCSMKNVSFGNARLDNADFSGAVLEGVKFKGAQLGNAKFTGAVLTGTDVEELNLPPEAFEGCVLDISAAALAKAGRIKAMIAAHEDWIVSNGEKGEPALLDGEDLRPLESFPAGRRLAGLCARRVIAIGVDFSETRLLAAKFDDADLRTADFSGCDLRGASLRGAKLAHARFDRARLGPLKLAQGGEILTDLTAASVTQDQLASAKLDRPLTEMGFK